MWACWQVRTADLNEQSALTCLHPFPLKSLYEHFTQQLLESCICIQFHFSRYLKQLSGGQDSLRESFPGQKVGLQVLLPMSTPPSFVLFKQ